MDILRWRVGEATVLRIAELDATAALQGPIPEFDLADVARAEWLTPDFVDARSDVLKRCAESDTLLIGAHFADPVAGRIRPNGSGFRLLPAAD